MTQLEYLNYANEVMKEYGEKSKFDIKLSKYTLIEIYKGYDHIVSVVSKAVMTIVIRKENIDKEEMLRKYIEYVDNIQSIEFRYGHINMISFVSKQDKTLYRCSFYGSMLNIPVSIKVYCLCLGISVNQYREYNDPDSEENNF